MLDLHGEGFLSGIRMGTGCCRANFFKRENFVIFTGQWPNAAYLILQCSLTQSIIQAIGQLNFCHEFLAAYKESHKPQAF